MIASVWFGVLTGLIEVTLLAIKKFALGQVVRVSGDVVWMSPVANLCWFLLVAAVLAAAVRATPPAHRFRVMFTVLVAVSAFAIVLHYSRLALVAKALIAGGIGVQSARMMARRELRFAKLVRQTLPSLAGLVLVLVAALYGWEWFGYQRAIARLPPNAERAPNVLLIVMDTARAANVGLSGYRRDTTPNLDRLAKTAARFDRAISPSPWTFPAHASMFTGRWPHELSANWSTPLNDTHATLAEVLRDRGYLTAGFAANIFWCNAEFGLDRGFLHFEDYPVSVSQTVMSSSIGREMISFSLDQDAAFRVREWIGYDEIPARKSAGEINESFLRWLTRQQSRRPFFAFLNYLDAHQPFLPPSPFDRKFLGEAPRGDPRHWWGRQWSPQEIEAERDSYDGTLAYIDQQIGALADDLERRGLLDDTLLIVTSDHGEHFGEHGFMRHANTLYMEVLNVPLVMRLPGRIPPATVRRPVSLRDLPATVLDVLGINCAGCLAGESLAGAWDGSTESRLSPAFSEVSRGIRLPDRYPNASGDMKSLIDGHFHYILNGDGSEELYALESDAEEQSNLARSADYAAVLADLRRRRDAIAGSAP